MPDSFIGEGVSRVHPSSLHRMSPARAPRPVDPAFPDTRTRPISRRSLLGIVALAGATAIAGTGAAHMLQREADARRKADRAAEQKAAEDKAARAEKARAQRAADEIDPSQPATPRSDWRQGSLPYIYQIDEQWADQPYAGATIKKSGCGPTSLSMVYVYRTGKRDMDPLAMASFAEQNGYVQGGLTAWTLMSEGAARLGLSSQSVGASTAAVASALASGSPVVVSVRPGDFTQVGHFMVLSALSNGRYLSIHDPNSKKNSALLWDIDRVLSQTAAAWAF